MYNSQHIASVIRLLCVLDFLRVSNGNPYEGLPSMSIIIRMYAGDYEIFKRYFLTGFQLFWPLQYLKNEVVLVFDNESSKDHEIAKLLANISPYPRIMFENHPGPGILTAKVRREGYARQIYSNFYLDIQSSREYVALADADSAFVTPILPEMLFYEEKPVMYAYNDYYSTTWCPQVVQKALGNKVCVAEFMVTVNILPVQ